MTRLGVEETLAASLHARIGRAMERMRMREQDAGGPCIYLGAGLGVEGNEGVLDGAGDLLRRRALPRRGPEEEGHLAAGRRKSRWNQGAKLFQSVSLVGLWPNEDGFGFPSLIGGRANCVVSVCSLVLKAYTLTSDTFFLQKDK